MCLLWGKGRKTEEKSKERKKEMTKKEANITKRKTIKRHRGKKNRWKNKEKHQKENVSIIWDKARQDWTRRKEVKERKRSIANDTMITMSTFALPPLDGERGGRHVYKDEITSCWTPFSLLLVLEGSASKGSLSYGFRKGFQLLTR